MSRYTRNQHVQMQAESTYKTDPGSWAGTHSVPVMSPRFTDRDMMYDRALMKGFMGANGQIYVTGSAEFSHSVEMGLSGVAGTAPAWGLHLLGMGFAETVTASTRVEYTPLSSGHSSVAIRHFEDGIMHLGLGARGTGSFVLPMKGIPTLDAQFTSLKTAHSATAIPTGDYTDWTKPLAINEANSAAWSVGPTYSSGSLSGGTTAISGDMRVNINNQVQHIMLLNGEAVDITDRSIEVDGTLYFSAADEVSYIDAMRATTATTLGFVLGGTGGSILNLWMNGVERVSAAPQDMNGRRVLACRFRAVPTAANNEMRVICK